MNSYMRIITREQNLRSETYGWLDPTDEPAAGNDMYCYNYDTMRMLRVWYNANHPAADLDHYDVDHFYEDAFKFRKN